MLGQTEEGGFLALLQSSCAASGKALDLSELPQPPLILAAPAAGSIPGVHLVSALSYHVGPGRGPGNTP